MLLDQPPYNSNYITTRAVLAKYVVTEKLLSKMNERISQVENKSGTSSRWRVEQDGTTYFYEPAISKVFRRRDKSKTRTSHQEAIRGTFPASDPLPTWASGSRDTTN